MYINRWELRKNKVEVQAALPLSSFSYLISTSLFLKPSCSFVLGIFLLFLVCLVQCDLQLQHLDSNSSELGCIHSND